MAKVKTPENFEAAIAELEEIAAAIEADNINLDVALEKYQIGMNLVKYCQDKLAEVEQKISILDNDTSSLKDFTLE